MARYGNRARLEVGRRKLERPLSDGGPGALELPEQAADRDPAVRRRVRRQPARRLLQLALAPDTSAPSGLVPGDGDVHEPLKEIAFSVLGASPRELELLVRGEELATADQRDPRTEASLLLHHVAAAPRATGRLRTIADPANLAQFRRRPCPKIVPSGGCGARRRPCYPHRVATILLVGVDLFFRGKLEGLLPGHHLISAESVDPPDLVIVDIARVEPDEVADAYPDVPILGFANHTDTAGLRRAHAAGFDRVVVKAALSERASELVAELTAPVEYEP